MKATSTKQKCNEIDALKATIKNLESQIDLLKMQLLVEQSKLLERYQYTPNTWRDSGSKYLD